MLAAETVDNVRKLPDIVNVIGSYVKLTKRGRNYIGLCPFHSEKSPSFTVSPEKRIWHCFGCHESGDLISFVQKVDHLTFVEAVKSIATQSNIEIIEENQPIKFSKQDQERKLVLDFLGEAKFFFIDQLKESANARRYFHDRQLNDESIEKWQLGFAPSKIDIKAMSPQFSRYESVLNQTGIIVKTESGAWVSRFRNRVIIPILDHNSRTIGFGGRLIEDYDNMAKYINSNENILFSKRQLLFGLNRAKSAIKREGYAILMEGYMDVMMAHQFGFQQTVGSMGTALTNEQVKLLARFTDTIYLALDNDNAGQQAMQRGYEVLKSHQFKVMVIPYDEKDPADFLLKYGPEEFENRIKNANSIIETLINRILGQNQNISAEIIPKVLDQLVPFLQQEKNTIIQNRYLTLISSKFGIDSELVLAKIQKKRYTKIPSRTNQNVQITNKYQKAEEWILMASAISLEHREKLRSMISESDFISDTSKNIYLELSKISGINHEILDQISNEAMKSKLVQILIEGEKIELISEAILEKCCETLKEYKSKQRIKEIKQLLKQSNTELSDEQELQLLSELQQLQFSKMEDANGESKPGDSDDYS